MAVPVTSQTVRDEAHFERIRPVLHALGTHYNLLVVLAVSVATAAGAAAAAPGGASSASNDAAKKLRAAWIAKVRQQDSGDDAAAAAAEAAAAAAAAASLTRRIEGSVAATATSSAAAAATTTFASLPVPADVLPSHRIVAASTVAGRVAFVRQVQRVGLVVDFDPAVHEQLSRFGHKVMVYDFDKL
jgi:hypothetical protein